MKIAICDDEQIYIDNVVQHLNFFSINNNIDFDTYTFTSADEVLECRQKFDIAILDVEIDSLNGIRLGEQLRKRNRHIILIYITAHKKYLDDALNLNAVRFFEKPLDSQRFYRGLKDAIKRIDTSYINFYIKENQTLERISVQDIIFIEIEKRKTRIVTQNKEYHSNHHISFWKDNLSNTIFYSPHKSYIINFNYVTLYVRNRIVLDDKYEIAIARNKQSDFNKKFMQYVEGK